MKYLKTFENKFSNVHKLRGYKKLDINIGDYVVTK